MKKLSGLLALVFVLLLGSSVLAQSVSVSSIGYIEVQKVFKGFNEAQSAQKKLSEQEKDFKKKFEESEEKLSKAREQGKSQADLEKMRKDLESSLEPERKRLMDLNEQLTAQLQKKIIDAVKKVSQKMNIEVVMDKQVVIVGGMDLTDMVISELNK